MSKKKSRSKDVLDKSPVIPQRDKINYELQVDLRQELTEKQIKLVDLMLDKKTNIIFVNGPAGTSKTFIAVYAALLCLQRKSQSDIIYIRSIVESASKSLGSLPGEISDKIGPFLQPLVDKLEEFLPQREIDQLIKEERVKGMPVNYLRGSSWNAKFVICDESQNFDKKELTTILTRLGKFSKLIVLGDSFQSDLNGRSAFMPMFDLFNNDESKEYGIHSFSFAKEDIVRNKILGYILDRLEGTYTPPNTNV
jgi:phosphate starvation-inducible PhoH-like protein